MNIREKSEALVVEFLKFSSWEDRYKKIIEMGKLLPDLPDSQKTEEAKIRGCQSQVWLHCRISDHGTLLLEGDSDALIVKGLVAVLLKIYSDETPDAILHFRPDFLKEMGFESNLSPSRANGLFAMLRQILIFATASSQIGHK